MSREAAVPTYDLTTATLDNGLRIVVNEDHSVPVAALNIWYDVGSRHEEPGRTGFAHLFEHLMFEGSAHVPKGDHWTYVHSAGGTLNASTWCDRTNYFETVPSNHLETMLWLEADRMGTLVVDQERFDTQREVVKNERRQRYENQPYGTWMERLHALAFPEGHPYHHTTIGSMADLDAATLDDVQAFHRRHYAPNNAVLTIVGDVDPAAAITAVERYFGGLEPLDEVPGTPDGRLPLQLGAEVREVVADVVPVPRLFVTHRIPPLGTHEYDVAVVLAAVLGAGRGSRLYRELVLERRLAQPPDGSMMDTWPFSGGISLMTGDAVAREGVDIAVLEKAFHEVSQTIRDGVSEAELERARAQLTGDWLHRMASYDSRADTISMYATLFDAPEMVNEQLPRLLGVTGAEVVDLAGRVLGEQDRIVLVYEPVAAQTEGAA